MNYRKVLLICAKHMVQLKILLYTIAIKKIKHILSFMMKRKSFIYYAITNNYEKKKI